MWFASWSRVNIFRSLFSGHGHRARSANCILTEATNSVRVQRISFESNEHFFEQPSELRSLGTRKQFHRLLEGRPSVGEQFHTPFSTGNSQVKGNGSTVFTWSSLDKAVRLKTIDQPNSARMRHSQNAGEEIDRLTGFMTNHAERRRCA